MSDLIALVYRQKTGCKSQSFHSIDELKAFTVRKPYVNEVLGVICFHDRREVSRTEIPAGKVVDYVSRTIETVRQNIETASSLAKTVLRQAEEENTPCAFWFISALSKLEGSRPYLRVGDVLQFAMEAMPEAAKEWEGYVLKTRGGSL